MSTPTRQPTVAVAANVQRAVAPDSYVVVARTVVYAADCATAVSALATRFGELDAVVTGLAHLHLDVERGAVSVHPDWNKQAYAGGGPSGWAANRHVRVIGSELSQVAELVGALGRVPAVEIEGPHWQLDRGNPAHAELAADAVREAIARAQRYATALGGTLGQLVELSDTGLGGGPDMRLAMGQGMSSDQVAGLETLDFTPQPIDLSASVQGRWYLTLPPDASHRPMVSRISGAGVKSVPISHASVNASRAPANAAGSSVCSSSNG